MENRRKSEENEMQLKAGQKAWKISKRRFSQTVRRPISQCENFANQFRNAKISQPKLAMRKFRNAKFRNAKCHFAMPISNFAMRKFRNAKFRTANFNFAMRKFRNAKFRNAKDHFALRNPLPLRNSYFQALSSSVINAEPP